ncbi:MAG: serine/threonine-protein kinase, partial [Gemmatales bacterium]|nr:serine/threonine-protein kinase [Gemmatales bacterium]MDW8386401.1 serine/threonine-protein kinase [Gemmatales bacterium]
MPNNSFSSTQSPPCIPDYLLLDEIGRGGMGIVYRARDLRLERYVAIKILNTGREAAAERFRAEAKITGQLQHPGIPAVHELGELPDGRPFLAMKLVEGRTLAELLKEQFPSPDRQVGGQINPANRGRLITIFEQICHAVGYAHAHRVIHRDLKPSNVMVGSHGEVQVMDWGLAKVLDPSRDREGAEDRGDPEATLEFVTTVDTPERGNWATKTGSVLGTPAYMPPEQAAGQIRQLDTRSDVFGLGAILCQILTGHAPYEGKDDNDRLVKAVRGDLSAAFAYLESCGAEPDLVALCKRCLAFNQEDRPADGNAVAQEVARIRQAAEERARRAELERAEAEARAVEQAKRRRVVQWAGGLIAAVLLLGLGLSLWQMQRAIEAEKQAVANERKAEAERDAKAQALQAAEKAARDLWAGLDVMTAEIAGESLATQKAISAEQKKFLDTMLPLYRELAQKRGNDVETRKQVAAAAYRVGMIQYRLGRLEEGVVAFYQARDAYATLAAEFPGNPEFRADLAKSHTNLGNLLSVTGRLAEAEQAYRNALAI